MYFDAQYKLENLTNGDSKSMNVDGSSESVTFKYAIPDGEIWWLDKIDIFLLDEGTMGHAVFGSLGAALTNGVKMRIKKHGDDYVVKDIHDNVDLMMAFNQNKMVGCTDNGFLNENDYYTGTMLFDPAIRLFGADGDLVKIVVEDDLTGIDRFEAIARFWTPKG